MPADTDIQSTLHVLQKRSATRSLRSQRRLRVRAPAWVTTAPIAAGDAPGADALSGLARAFFYAGARALLVSHWKVDSDAAVRLTTGTFAALQKDPAIGRAEALRRAMLATIHDPKTSWNAYPALAAPSAPKAAPA